MARRTTTRRRGAAKKNSLRVDFTNVGKAFKAGEEYRVRILEVTLEEGQKAPYLNVKLCGAEPEFEGSFMYHRASTSETSLWRLRPFLEAFGVDIPEGPMDIDLEDLVDREAIATTYLDRWDGGSSVKPEDFFPVDGTLDDADEEEEEADEEEDEDEKPAPRSRKSKAKAKSAPEPVSTDEVNEMNEDELEDLVSLHDLDVDLGGYRTLRKKANAVIDALEEADLLAEEPEEEEVEEEEEEEEKPAPRRRRSRR